MQKLVRMNSAKIGLHATGKTTKRKTRTGVVFETDDIYALYEKLEKGSEIHYEPHQNGMGRYSG